MLKVDILALFLEQPPSTLDYGKNYVKFIIIFTKI